MKMTPNTARVRDRIVAGLLPATARRAEVTRRTPAAQLSAELAAKMDRRADALRGRLARLALGIEVRDPSQLRPAEAVSYNVSASKPESSAADRSGLWQRNALVAIPLSIANGILLCRRSGPGQKVSLPLTIAKTVVNLASLSFFAACAAVSGPIGLATILLPIATIELTRGRQSLLLGFVVLLAKLVAWPFRRSKIPTMDKLRKADCQVELLLRARFTGQVSGETSPEKARQAVTDILIGRFDQKLLTVDALIAIAGSSPDLNTVRGALDTIGDLIEAKKVDLDAPLRSQLAQLVPQRRELSEAVRKINIRALPLLEGGVGNFKRVREIGQGGQATTWLAVNTGKTPREYVSVKLLPLAKIIEDARRQFPDAADANKAKEQVLRNILMFSNEYNAGKTLDSATFPNLCRVLDTNIDKVFDLPQIKAYMDKGSSMSLEAREAFILNFDLDAYLATDVFIATEHIGVELVGATLDAPKISRANLGDPDSVALQKVFLPVLEALVHAHSRGVYHRDLKPANLLLTSRAAQNFIVVIDLGIAKIEGVSSGLTHAAGFGSDGYMPPNDYFVAGAKDSTNYRFHDIFAFGAIAYEMVTGEKVFDGIDLMQYFGNPSAFTTQIKAKVKAKVQDPGLQAFILKALSAETEENFQSMADVVEAWQKIGTAAASKDAFDKTRSAGGAGGTTPPPLSAEQALATKLVDPATTDKGAVIAEVYGLSLDGDATPLLAALQAIIDAAKAVDDFGLAHAAKTARDFVKGS